MIHSALTVILILHILAGVTALLAGFVAIVTTKGSRRHKTAGKYYVIAMSVVVVTAAPLAVAIESWFLLAITIFTGYLVFAGVRVINRRRSRVEHAELIDKVGHGAMIVAGGGMVAAGVWEFVFKPVELGPVIAVFGGTGIGLAIRELRTLNRPLPDQIPWMNRHIGFMGGAYIATVTAAITVNLTMLPALARWLTPTLIGVPCIVIATRKYEARFSRGGEGTKFQSSRSEPKLSE